MKCAYLNDSNLYLSEELPNGVKQLKFGLAIKRES